jgi:cell division protein FtsL
MWQWCWQAIREAWAVCKVIPLVAIPVAIGLSHVWTQFRVTNLGYEISQETSRHEKLVDRHRKLTVELGVEGRSDQVERRGRRQFGLHTVQPGQVIDVSLSPTAKTPKTEHASLEPVLAPSVGQETSSE